MKNEDINFVSNSEHISNARQEQYKNLAPDKWKEIVKSVIYGMLVLTDPNKWASSWVETYQNLIKQNELVSFPVPLEDIEMMYQTMAGEMRETIPKRLMSLGDLLSTEYPAARFILDPYFEANAVNMVSAPPNTWKSWLFFSLASSVASGSQLWDHFDTEQHKVMIVNEEDSPRSVQDRFKMLGITNKELPIYFHIAQGLKIDKKFVENIVKEMQENGIDVLMLDSLRSMHEAEENDSTAMQVILDHLKTIARNNITVVFTHHHRKRNALEKNQSADASRGSSAINAAISGHISLDEEKRDNGTFLILHHLKSKVSAKLDPVEIKISKADLTGMMTFEYQGTFKSSNKKIEQSKEAIINQIKTGGWMTVNDFVAMEIASDSIIRTAFRELKRAGVVMTMTRAEAKAKSIEVSGEGRANELIYHWCEGEDNGLDVYHKDLITIDPESVPI